VVWAPSSAGADVLAARRVERGAIVGANRRLATAGRASDVRVAASRGMTTIVFRRTTGAGTALVGTALRPTGRFASPLTLSTRHPSAPGLAVASSGASRVVWVEPDPAGYRLMTAVRAASGAWSAPTAVITGSPGVAVEKPQVVAHGDGGATVAWLTRRAGASAGAGVRMVAIGASGSAAGAPAVVRDGLTAAADLAVGGSPTRAFLAWRERSASGGRHPTGGGAGGGGGPGLTRGAKRPRRARAPSVQVPRPVGASVPRAVLAMERVSSVEWAASRRWPLAQASARGGGGLTLPRRRLQRDDAAMRRAVLAMLIPVAVALPAVPASAARWSPATTLTDCGDVLGAGLDRPGAAEVLLAVRDDCAGADPPGLVWAVHPGTGDWMLGSPAALPAEGEWSVLVGDHGHAFGWRRVLDGGIEAATRRDGVWSPVQTLAEGVVSHDVVQPAAAMATDGTAVIAWVADRSIHVATSSRGGPWSDRRVAGARGLSSGFWVSVNDSGDALVTWGRRVAEGGVRISALDRRPNGEWSAPRAVARVGEATAFWKSALDPAGRGIVAWEDGRGRILVAEHGRAAARWARPARVGMGEDLGVSGLATDGAGKAVLVSGGTDPHPGVRMFVRAPGRSWGRPTTLPRAVCCAVALAVGPLGDVAVSGAYGSRLAGRTVGGRWTTRSLPLDAMDPRLSVNAAGDMLAVVPTVGSIGSVPVLAYTLRAPGRPVVRALGVGSRGAPTPRVRLALSRPGRVLLTLRRGLDGPVVAATMLTPRRRVATFALPPRLRRALGAGRFSLTADTGRSSRTTAFRRAR
jgi:hypothetical protein